MTPDDPASRFLDASGLLNPTAIAVVGASEKPGNIGGDTVRRLTKFPFPGPVWAVNPSSSSVAGVPCFASLAELPGVPDLVIMAVPAPAVIETVREAAALGIHHGVAFAGGFAEAGGEGKALQARLVAACRQTGFKLCGPNCVGIINTAKPAILSFATVLHEVDVLRTGPISMVSQSGGIGTNALSIASAAGFGFRHLISGGNEAVVDFSDYLFTLARDEGTHIIAAYLEGVTDGDKLASALQEARRRGKPVVMIKAGTTSASATAAQAHTGSLVGEDRVFDAVLGGLGVIRVYSVEELVDVCLLLAGLRHGRMPAGGRVGIATFGGGNGVLAVDQCAQHGLETPRLQPETIARLKTLIPSVATASNPLDLTPSTAFRAEALAQLPAALDAFVGDPGIDAVMFIAGGLASRAKEIATVMREFWARSDKPVSICWPTPPIGVVEGLASHGIVTFLEPQRIARALGRMARARRLARVESLSPPATLDGIDWPVASRVGTPTVITEDRCHALLRKAGLPVAAGELARSPDQAKAVAVRLGCPVALKGISTKVTHRAKAGLLAIGLASPDDVEREAARLFAHAAATRADLEGLYVQRMVKGGVELLVSAFRDAVFGPVIMCGSGGGMTELLDDVATARAPIDARGAEALLGRLRMAAHARDSQGALPLGPPAAFIAGLSQMAASTPWQRFTIEVNPIIWTRQGVVAVDGLIIVEQP